MSGSSAPTVVATTTIHSSVDAMANAATTSLENNQTRTNPRTASTTPIAHPVRNSRHTSSPKLCGKISPVAIPRTAITADWAEALPPRPTTNVSEKEMIGCLAISEL
jgi:hypothetical protein